MTREEILAMEAGPEMDALVAKVMDITILTKEEMEKEALGVWKEQPSCVFFSKGFKAYRTEQGIYAEQIFKPYSTNIAAAWKVVEKMADCLHLRQHGEQGTWEASFCGYPGIKGHGESAPLAICRAALLTKLNN